MSNILLTGDLTADLRVIPLGNSITLQKRKMHSFEKKKKIERETVTTNCKHHRFAFYCSLSLSCESNNKVSELNIKAYADTSLEWLYSFLQCYQVLLYKFCMGFTIVNGFNDKLLSKMKV